MSMQHRHLPLRVALTVLLSVCLAAFAVFASAQESDDERRVVDTQLVVKGNERMEKFLQSVLDANTRQNRRRPPEPVTVLQRAQLQQQQLTRALRAEGYYAATIEARFAGYRLDDPAIFDQLETIDRGDRIEVRFDINIGPQYKLKSPIILDAKTERPLPPTLMSPDQLEVQLGTGAESAKIIATDEQIVRQLKEHGHAYGKIDNREAVVDHADQSMTVTWKVTPGPVVQFGAVEFKGLERTRESFLRQRIPFEPGEQYTPARIDQLRDEMLELGIFSTVKLTPAPQLDAQNRLPVTIEVVERAPRTIGFGASYATSEGFGANAYWQHRNLFGGAETLRLTAEVGGLLENKITEPNFGLYAKYREPDIWERDLDFTADLYAERKELDAYDKEAVGAAVGLERLFSKGFKGSIGLLAEHSIQKRDSEKHTFTLFGVPMTAALDRSNDLLNPTEGYRVTAALTPFIDTLNPGSRFVVGRLTGTAYLDLSSDKTTVLAGRAGIASLLDLGNSLVPFDRRIYAGGGGSVRGYAFQSLGPRDGKDPLGGRSSMELSAELRQRISGRIGMVVFVDAGNVWETSTPKPTQGLQYAAGVGARYYTDFGPLRLDVAVPINRRTKDDRFGLYVSLGQAF
jgi:translocation and assembly module TamA